MLSTKRKACGRGAREDGAISGTNSTPFLSELGKYSFRDGRFYKRGTAITGAERDPVLKRAIAGFDPDFARGTGSATLARALVTAAAERAVGSGAEWGVLPSAAASLNEIRYSTGGGSWLRSSVCHRPGA